MVELIDLVSLAIISSVVILNQLANGGNALNCTPDFDARSPALFNFYLSSDPSFLLYLPSIGEI